MVANFTKFNVVFIGVFLLLMFGCASPATGPTYSAELVPANNESLLYIYRPYVSEISSINTSMFLLNGKPLAELKSGGYSVVKLPPGNYELVHTWAPHTEKGRASDLTLKIRLLPGQTHFVEFLATTYPAGPVFFLREVNSKAAQEKITNCKKSEIIENNIKEQH